MSGQALNRRRFLELVVASAGAALPMAGCASDRDEGARRSADPGEYFRQSVASGDPRSNSVILWTRVTDADRPLSDLELTLEVARDEAMNDLVALEGEASLPLRALGAYDGCVKVRVTDLEPATTYYYRFGYQSALGRVFSRVGRTKTAPPADADVPVRFAVACCQDYDEKYYHLHRWLSEQDLDFVLFLGDYVYETASPAGAGGRRVVFSRPEQAISIDGRGFGGGRLAARSLDNYRDLYRTYRSDQDLQRVHERFPFIAIWDDHEFSNDSHGATATYLDGRSDERDLERRAAADQAWFEYMPVDYSEAPAAAWDPESAFPDDLAIYRSFVFGRHVELVMTDCRRYRPDHLVEENAFPGTLFVTEDELTGTISDDRLPLVAAIDLDSDEYAEYRAFLEERAASLGFRATSMKGWLSVPFINDLLARIPDSPPPLDVGAAPAVRGYAYHQLLKTAEFSSAGARYLVAYDPFRALAQKRFTATQGESERMLGRAQREWFLDTIRQSTRTFKLWGSSLCVMPRQLDLSAAQALPEEFRTRLIVTVEDWDGYPNERSELLRALSDVHNVVVFSGDLHCFFVGELSDPDSDEHRLIEFVTGSVSSSTWLREIRSVVESDPSLPPEVALAASSVGSLLADPQARPNPHMAFQELERNGVTVVRVDGEALQAELVLISPSVVARPPTQAAEDVSAALAIQRFRVEASSRALLRDVDDKTFRFDSEVGRWQPA